jgi:hypothetical protein
LLVAAPALALYNRDKTEELVRQRALEIAPSVIRGVAGKVGPKIDAMVDEFGARLDAWIVVAGQELHQEVIEVLRSVSQARTSSESSDTSEALLCDQLDRALAELSERLSKLKRPTPAAQAEEAFELKADITESKHQNGSGQS